MNKCMCGFGRGEGSIGEILDEGCQIQEGG